MVLHHYLRRVGRFDYVHHVNGLCLGGGYIIFPLRLVCLSGNDEINEDARNTLDLYVADEEESPNIPLPDGIPIDLGAKEPVLSPRSPPMDLWNYISQGRLVKRKFSQRKRSLLSDSSQWSKVAMKRPVEKTIVTK